MRIYKYELKITDDQHIRIPSLVDVLDIQIQGKGFNEKLVLWATVNEGNGFFEGVTVHIIGTGQEFGDDNPHKSYVRTFQTEGFVGHVFISYDYL